MAKTAMVIARIEPELKKDSAKVLKRLGISITEAVNLFLSQVRLQKGLPFEVKIPNKTTLDTFKKTDAGKALNKYKNMEKRGKDIDKLNAIMQKLINEDPLEPKYRNHALKGNFKDRRECHREPDWLLIYKINAQEKMIIFERTG